MKKLFDYTKKELFKKFGLPYPEQTAKIILDPDRRERLITSLEAELAHEQELRMLLEGENRKLRGKLEKAEAVIKEAKELLPQVREHIEDYDCSVELLGASMAAYDAKEDSNG